MTRQRASGRLVLNDTFTRNNKFFIAFQSTRKRIVLDDARLDGSALVSQRCELVYLFAQWNTGPLNRSTFLSPF